MSRVHHVVSGQARLALETAGHGLPVVFLHANVADRRMWQTPFERLAAAHQVIAYDRRGFGQSRAALQAHSAVADLMAVLDATCGAQPAVLVGCSQGARIALDAALMHPQRVHALVLASATIDGAPAPEPDAPGLDLLQQQAEAAASGDAQRLIRLRARLWLDGPLAAEGRVAGAARGLFETMNAQALALPAPGASTDATDAFARLETLQCPALALWGALDFPHIQARTELLARRLPQARGQCLPQAAHLPGLDQPEATADRIRDFLAGLAG
ncbi:alpha/beta fold hydrolase [Bordetella trematum]|uniref:alpha/beta fold hydrolase n=1 Tax=Bordetella trematum TaxID=123899 RepID=UPI0013FDC369|nr:alpha/beta hydrolase [Bordetella trematum]